MYSRYLVKQALENATVAPTQPDDSISLGDRAKAYMASTAIGLPALPATLGAAYYLGGAALPEEKITPEVINAVIKEVGADKLMAPTVSHGIPKLMQIGEPAVDRVLRATTTAYDPFAHDIRIHPDMPRVALAHEAGHAANLFGSPNWEKVQTVARHPLYTNALAPLVGYLAAKKFKNQDPESVWSGAGHGALVGGAGSTLTGLPVLAEEASASLKGLAALKRLGASSKEMWRGRAKMLAGIMTYLLGHSAAGASIGGYVGGKEYYRSKQRKEREKGVSIRGPNGSIG